MIFPFLSTNERDKLANLINYLLKCIACHCSRYLFICTDEEEPHFAPGNRERERKGEREEDGKDVKDAGEERVRMGKKDFHGNTTCTCIYISEGMEYG